MTKRYYGTILESAIDGSMPERGHIGVPDGRLPEVIAAVRAGRDRIDLYTGLGDYIGLGDASRIAPAAFTLPAGARQVTRHRRHSALEAGAAAGSREEPAARVRPSSGA